MVLVFHMIDWVWFSVIRSVNSRYGGGGLTFLQLNLGFLSTDSRKSTWERVQAIAVNSITKYTYLYVTAYARYVRGEKFRCSNAERIIYYLLLLFIILII